MYTSTENVLLVKDYIWDERNMENKRLIMNNIINFDLFKKWCSDKKINLIFDKSIFDLIITNLFSYNQ
jgi:hypothetical protein